MCLVINYKPLNSFMQDDKFFISNKQLFFLILATAKILSKFNLKVGFWQFGVHPDDRHNSAFNLPRYHFQWTIMSFGPKTISSLFQKMMTQIFAPLQKNVLIYINNILLFSETEKQHIEIFITFHKIVEEHYIMLSKKKIIFRVNSIESLVMKISNGIYVPQPYIAIHLFEFLNFNLITKLIQQFLGIVNHIYEFVFMLSKITKPFYQILKKNSFGLVYNPDPTHSQAQIDNSQTIFGKYFILCNHNFLDGCQ